MSRTALSNARRPTTVNEVKILCHLAAGYAKIETALSSRSVSGVQEG
jgi:hypothetical protein